MFDDLIIFDMIDISDHIEIYDAIKIFSSSEISGIESGNLLILLDSIFS